MSNKLLWELVHEEPFDSARTPLPEHRLFRARVPGGWLVLVSAGKGGPGTPQGITFVPGTEWANEK